MQKGFSLVETLVFIGVFFGMILSSFYTMKYRWNFINDLRLKILIKNINSKVLLNNICDEGNIKDNFKEIDLEDLPADIFSNLEDEGRILNLKSGSVEYNVKINPKTGAIKYHKK